MPMPLPFSERRIPTYIRASSFLQTSRLLDFPEDHQVGEGLFH